MIYFVDMRLNIYLILACFTLFKVLTLRNMVHNPERNINFIFISHKYLIQNINSNLKGVAAKLARRTKGVVNTF